MDSSREAGSALAAYAAPEQHMQMEDEHPGLQDPFSANALLASYHALSDEQCRCASEHVPAAAALLQFTIVEAITYLRGSSRGSSRIRKEPTTHLQTR